MLIVLFVLFALIFVSIKSVKGESENVFSMEQTQSIKGIFVITIFLSHFCSYVSFDKWYDLPIREYCRWLGQLMVVPFLFYSGYGIFESVKKKGLSYVRSFPKKRILKTLVHFDLAILLFLLYDLFFLPENLSLLKILLSLVAWDSIGNSNWFIFAILCAYVFSYIGLLLGKGRLSRSFIVITILCLVYVVAVSKFKVCYWYDTILAFPFGCFVSVYKDQLTIGRKMKNVLWGCSCLVLLLLLLLAKKDFITSSFLNSQIALFGFMSLIVLLSIKVKIESKILSWFGTQVFGVYILQRLPMNFGKYINLNEQNVYLYFTFCFVVTLLLAICFNKITNRIDSILFKG
jgi:hypothetical protein